MRRSEQPVQNGDYTRENMAKWNNRVPIDTGPDG